MTKKARQRDMYRDVEGQGEMFRETRREMHRETEREGEREGERCIEIQREMCRDDEDV